MRDLITEYSRSGEMDLVLNRLEAGRVEASGFWGASLAFFLAAWETRKGSGPVVVIAPSQDEADQLFEEISSAVEAPAFFFPPWESLFLPDSEPDPESCYLRLSVLEQLTHRPSEPCFVVAPVQSILQPVPPAEVLRAARVDVSVGADLDPAALAASLVERGMRAVPLTDKRGELSHRGDVLDVFGFEGPNPLRIEFFGDTVESIREFRPETQRSIAGSEREACGFLLVEKSALFRDCFRGEEPLLVDLLGTHGEVVVQDSAAVHARAAKIFRNVLGGASDDVFASWRERVDAKASLRTSVHPESGASASGASSAVALEFGSVERFQSADLDRTVAELRSYAASGRSVRLICDSEAEVDRLAELLGDHGLQDPAATSLVLEVGSFRRGFEAHVLNTAVLTARELLGRQIVRRVRSRTAPGRAITNFVELKQGDYIVHVVHGIGRYLGIERFKKDGLLQEFLALEYRGQTKVYVPVSKIELVQKYIGSGDRPPTLDKIGGVSWARKKEAVESALVDLASDLLELQALRTERKGVRFEGDTEWQRAFEAAFPFEDTPDQVTATEAIKRDMVSDRPMDRLICGDVGYGKTELAMRAAFKAVENGYQVGILVPTTILAQQHFRTFTERAKGFPVTVDVLSRFRSAKEQRAVLRAAAEGRVDVLVGTHRLLSDDVVFRNLGLLVVDEEQRFGVAHKEKFKRLRSCVDVLTMTATPIPRTLHMSLLGIKDISSLTTAPAGRTSVDTEVMRFDPDRVREIIIRELNRDGQVFFLHNRIHDIDRVRFELERIVPEARIVSAHGRMKEDELEEVMVRFLGGEIDVLVSTTIIGSGIDIRSANTIFVDEADIYGLADLHQLRGRVGRYRHQAYCYLILPEHRHVNPEAAKRLQALVEFSDLGAGFQIAMRDLELRGAGNILGPEQSGHIAAVGYEMYCRLLEATVRRLREEDYAEPVHVEVEFAVQALIPDDYLPGEGPKIDVYRRVSQAANENDVREIAAEIRDRFGELPPPVETLIDLQILRIHCARSGVEAIRVQDGSLVLEGRESMGELLESCPLRVAVLDSRTAAIRLVHPARRYAEPPSDDLAFRIALEWVRNREFPVDLLDGGAVPSGARAR